MALQTDVVGLKDLEANLKAIAAVITGAELADSLATGAQEIVWEAQKNIMAQGLHESGDLRDSIHTRKINQFRVDIVVGAVYGAAMEYGQIQIVTDKQRRFFWAKFAETGDDMWKAMALSTKLTTPARPYLRPAIDTAKKAAILTVAQSLGGRFAHVIK